MIRSALRFVAAAILILLTGLALVGWVRSHAWGDALRYYEQPNTLDLMSVDGLIAVGWGELESVNYPPPKGWEGSFWPFERNVDYIDADLSEVVGSTFLGFGQERHQRVSATSKLDVRTILIPWWFITLLPAVAAAYPVARIAAGYRRKRYASTGRCCECGYDLRASTDRCPECGLPAGGVA